MEGSNSCKPKRNSGWDASYRNCLCLLLSLTGLTFFVVFVIIFIPGKSSNIAPVRQIPENFDPVPSEKLLTEYKYKSTTKPSTKSFDYTPSYTTSRVPKSTKTPKDFQPVKKIYKKPIRVFIPTTSIRPVETTINPVAERTEKSVASSYDSDQEFINSSEISKTSVSYLSEISASKIARIETTEISRTTEYTSSKFPAYKETSGTFILDETVPASRNPNKSEKIQHFPQQTNEGVQIEQEQKDRQDQLLESEVQLIYQKSEAPLKSSTQKEEVTTPKSKQTSTTISEQQLVEIVPQENFKSDKLQEFPQKDYKEQYLLKPYISPSKIVTYSTPSLVSTKIYIQTEPSQSLLTNPDFEQRQVEQIFKAPVRKTYTIYSYDNDPPILFRGDEQISTIKPFQVTNEKLTSHSVSQDVLNGNSSFKQRTIVKEKIIKVTCPESPPICSTKTCKRSASEIIALIDHNSDPCDDFYWYACNGLEINRMEDRSSESVILEKIKDFTPSDPLENEFKNLYDSCMDFSAEDNNFYAHNFIEDLFNDTKYKGLTKVDALTELISKVLALNPRGSNFRLLPIFDLTVGQDGSGSFVPTLTIPTEENLMVEMNTFDIYEEQCIRQISSQPQTTVQKIYEAYIECSHNIAPYILNLNATLYSLGVLDYLPKLNRSQKIIDIEQDVQFDVYDVLGAVTKRLKLEHLQSTDVNSIYMNLDQLQVAYPQLNWTTLFSNLFKTRFSQIKTVRLLFKQNLDSIFEFFQNTKFVKIKNLIMAMLLHDLHMDLKTVENKCKSENFCLKLSTKVMEDVAAKILVSKVTKKDLSLLDEYIGGLVFRIKDKFRKILELSEWLSSNQKQILLGKLEKIKVVSDPFNLYFNDRVLSYRNANLKLGKNFAENLLKIRLNKRVLTYEKVTNNPGSVWMYAYNPMATELFTIAKSHQIVIPVGLLSKFAVKKRSYPREYEILAKLGFAISKAILSFFTPANIYAILPDLKQNDELKNFIETELADPPLTHFENIFALAVSKEDIKLTINDRFSDDGGLSLAYETFLNNSNIRSDPLLWLNLTSSQLFYLAFAQNFCEHKKPMAHIAVEISENYRLPPYYRVNSAVMNSVAFAEEFGCRVGSSMNPEFKVKAFPRIEQVQVHYGKT